MEKVLNIILLNIYSDPGVSVVTSRWAALSEALRLYCHPRSTWSDVMACLQRCGFWAEALALEARMETGQILFAQCSGSGVSPGFACASAKGAEERNREVLSLEPLSGEHLLRNELSGDELSGDELFGGELSGDELLGDILSGEDISRVNLFQAMLPLSDLCGSLSIGKCSGSGEESFERNGPTQRSPFKLEALSAFSNGYPKNWVDRLGASAPPVIWVLTDGNHAGLALPQQHQLAAAALQPPVRGSKRGGSKPSQIGANRVAIASPQKIVSGVGCRQAELWALEASRSWARLLSEEGFTLASGGANGCDQEFINTARLGGQPLRDVSEDSSGFQQRAVSPATHLAETAAGVADFMRPGTSLEESARMEPLISYAGASTIEIIPYGFSAGICTELTGYVGDTLTIVGASRDGIENSEIFTASGVELARHDEQKSSVRHLTGVGTEITTAREIPVSAGPRFRPKDSSNAVHQRSKVASQANDRDESSQNRSSLMFSSSPSGQHLVVSPFPLGTSFSGSNAMIRNRLIYAIGDFTIVFSARFKEGGTWGGATAALRAHRIVWVVEPPANASQSHKKAFLALTGLGAMVISRFASVEELQRMIEVSTRLECTMTRASKHHSRLTQSLFAS